MLQGLGDFGVLRAERLFVSRQRALEMSGGGGVGALCGGDQSQTIDTVGDGLRIVAERFQTRIERAFAK